LYENQHAFKLPQQPANDGAEAAAAAAADDDAADVKTSET
jgi:hypothetical protein